MPSWSRRRPKGQKKTSRAEMPLRIGPDTDQVAFRAELKAVLDELMQRMPAPKGEDVDAAVREVCARHGVIAGATLETSKLSEPLQSITTFGAAAGRVQVGQADGRWFVTDHRWALYIDEEQVAELRAAGAEFMERKVPAFGRLMGKPRSFDVMPSAYDMLRRYGIGGRGISKTTDGWTNLDGVDLDGSNFAADVLAVLAVAGAVQVVVDHEQRMVEGRSATGRTVGYGMGTRPLLN